MVWHRSKYVVIVCVCVCVFEATANVTIHLHDELLLKNRRELDFLAISAREAIRPAERTILIVHLSNHNRTDCKWT